MISDVVMVQILTCASFLIGLIIRYLFMSKCSHFQCCCLKVQRQTEHEQQIKLDIADMKTPSPPTRNTNFSNV